MTTLTIGAQLMTPLLAIRPIVEAQGTHIVTVEDDGGGAYMSLHDLDSTFDLEAYSNLALAVITKENPYEDIASYRWVFLGFSG